MSGTVIADSLVMGPVTLTGPSATLLIHPDRAEFADLDAGLLGGHLHATGSLRWAGTDQATILRDLSPGWQAPMRRS